MLVFTYNSFQDFIDVLKLEYFKLILVTVYLVFV